MKKIYDSPCSSFPWFRWQHNRSDLSFSVLCSPVRECPVKVMERVHLSYSLRRQDASASLGWAVFCKLIVVMKEGEVRHPHNPTLPYLLAHTHDNSDNGGYCKLDRLDTGRWMRGGTSIYSAICLFICCKIVFSVPHIFFTRATTDISPPAGEKCVGG